MAAFGLDDVREAFTSDVARFLADVEASANVVVAAAGLAIAAEPSRRAPVETMVVGLHGIVGSSSLIGLDTLTGPARRLEGLAESAAESIREITRHATRLSRIAAVCLDGATEIRAILDHELAGRTAEARGRSAALHARLDATGALLALHGSVAEADPGSAAAGNDPVGAQADDDELGRAFRDEARETLTNLQGCRARLIHQPDDREAAAQCARLLHLLRGSAAMVGRDALASRTAELNAWLEAVRRAGVTAAAVETLGHRLDDLAELTLGARPRAVVAPPPAGQDGEPRPGEDGEPRQILFDEVRRALDELRAAAAQLEATAGPARDAAAARSERVLHRLKGSALIVGEPRIAELATRGQAACEPPERIDPAALAAVVAQLAAVVAPEAARPLDAVPFAPPSAEEWDAYLEESSELFDQLDRALGMLEQSVRPTAELSAMFRTYHTLKGASSAVGLAPIAQQLHAIESFVERIVAAPELPPLRGVVAALGDEHAAMRGNVARAARRAVLEVDLARTAARLAAAADRGAAAGGSWIAASDPAWATPVWDPAFDGDAPALRSPASRPARVVTDVAPEAVEAASDPSGAPSAGGEFVGRRFVRVAADRLDGLLDLVGELVVARSRMLTRLARMQQLQDDDQLRHGAVIRLVDQFATSTEFAYLDGRRGGMRVHAQGPRGATSPVRTAGAARAGFGALELDHYDEIHVLSRQLDEAASDIHEMRREIAGEMQRLTEDAEALSTIVGGLQAEITQARMLTVDALFTRLQLPIRDAAQRQGREIEIVCRGEQVAIDKAISDALFGPLLHLVRNAVAHGIEPPARRVQLGKPRAGVVTLSARQDHGQIILEIADDGAGIDTARLKVAGVARGVLDAAVPEADPRVLELVFAHGVSTAGEAGDVAGRGVGGNVVRRAVERLSGTIEIATAPGTGTTFRIALPLSMSITQAVIVRTAGVTLAIPIAFAETIVARDGHEPIESFGRARVQIAGHVMPVHHTPRLFDEAQGTGGVFVVCLVGTERVAILADAVVGQEEIVVKSLGTLLDGHPLFSGSTQRGDGELVLILDVPGVLAAETGELGPAARVDREDPARPAALPALVAAAPAFLPLPGGRHRVLFVDDSLSVRKVAERMLRALGVDVVTAIDGQDALDKLRTTAFSLVFTDLEMPRLHGYELLREMQYLPAHHATPTVVISSRSGQKHVDQALEMGAREYLTKPFSSEVLQAVLGRWARGPAS